MATCSSSIPILFLATLLLCSFCYGQRVPKPRGFILGIKKDEASRQYYTSIEIGWNSTQVNVVIDTGGNFLWFNSPDYFNAASSYRPILCGTQQCRIANGIGCIFCFLSPPVPGCTNNTCSDYSLNPYSGTQGYSGLGQDLLRLYSTRPQHQYNVRNFPFQFSDPVLREGLPSPTAGVIALGRTRVSLQAQVASAFNIPQKFALCIPSSGNVGNLIIGDAAYAKPFSKISHSLSTTPLVTNPVSTSGNEVIGNLSIAYFINVKSIKVGGTSLALNNTLLSINKKTGDGGTSIRTVRGYTSLHRSIYTALINEFVKAAANKGVKRVASVAPFGACFDSNTITSSNTGPDVPTIDLLLHTKTVYWRFYGSNSMVRVGNDVICLAFVEGPPNQTGPTTSIVVGGYQMENYLLQFDDASSTLGFSSTLLLHHTSCSHFGAA